MNIVVVVIYLMGVLTMGLVVRLIPGATSLQVELGASAAQTGLVLGLIGLPGLLGPFVGALSDRIGPDRMMLFAGLAAAALSLLITVTTNIELVMAIRLLDGLAFVALTASTPVILLRLTEGKAQVAAMALWATTPSVGSSVAFVLAGVLGAASWRLLFILYAVLFGVVSVAAFVAIRRRLRAGADVHRVPFKPAALVKAYGDATLMRLFGAYLLLTMAVLGFTTVFPQVAVALFGWSSQITSQALGAGNLAVIPGAAIGGFLLGKTGAFRPLVAVMSVLATLCFVILNSPAMSGGVVTAALMGVFFLQGGIGTAVMASLPRLVPPERQGLAMGMLGQFGSFGVFIASPIWLFMWARGGGPMLIVGGAATCLLMPLIFPPPRKVGREDGAGAVESQAPR